MIEVREVTKTFGSTRALDGVSLTVPRGSVYGLVGPNGAGKSTVISHISGVYRPDSGTVTIDGQPVYDNVEAKKRVFSIYDDIYFHMGASMRDMKRLLAGVYPTFDAERYAKLAAAFPDIDEKTPLRRFSKGMVRQSAFWLAMSCRPEILLLDEPVDGLDPVMRRRVWSLLAADVAEYGTTVLLSSHNLRELEDVCDHVGILDRGKMLIERNLSELQGSVAKVQVLFPEGVSDPALPEDIEVLHTSATGRMRTYIVRLAPAEAQARLSAFSPQYVEAIPLSLEEIFIYEMGGADDAIHDILL
ncbi:MAG: ABC transporter ATP-binding protein [Coriobacteriales bacterium]|jgi:ABC-2 type transport system ATP-binding protein